MTNFGHKLRARSEHSLDEKGRVILPTRFREALTEEFMLVAWPGPCLRIYPMALYDQLEIQLLSRDVLDESDADLQMLQRILHNGEVVSLDPQFRMTISRYFRNWAEFGKMDNENIILIGMGDRIELWSLFKWEEYSKNLAISEASSAGSRLRNSFLPAERQPESAS